jgi:hypothetical protein
MVKEKSKKTWLKKYGVDNPNKSKVFLNKAQSTRLRKYGDKNYNNPEKNKQTMLSRYGVEMVAHVPEFHHKQQTNSYKIKQHVLPSGKIINCRGYEPFAIDYLLKNGFTENDLILNKKEMPSFWYDGVDGTVHRYYPDIFIPIKNLIIEVKSPYTNGLSLEINELKKKAVVDSGFNFQKLVFDKKKILLLSDDLRMFSGVACQSRELVLNTIHHYDWVQMAGAVTHPEAGRQVDMCAAANEYAKIKDAYLKLYPVNGYGDENILFAVMENEKPDALMIFTDPRFWGWLFQIERKIRQKIPLTFLNIWDDVPYPQWNRPFYESCDSLFSISKQTYNINKWVLGPENCCTVDGEFDTMGNLIKKQKELI